MHSAVKFLISIIFVVIVAADSETPQPRKFLRTPDRIEAHGYPVETHTVQTSDAYILTMYRIPHSPKLKNEKTKSKPIAFLMHGLVSSSDCWILNGPNDALGFILADAGYDVWMGNARGNLYSKKHATKSSHLPSFWNFSWNEIGLFDLPAMIDYILYKTSQATLHYIAHSQGSTAFLVLLSSLPAYNKKIKTSHMLAPVAYMGNAKSPLVKIAGPLLGTPSVLSNLIGSNEFLPSNKFLSMLGRQGCEEKSPFIGICTNVLFLICGWDSQHLNYTLVSDVVATHPAGSSSSQIIHYLQEYQSGYFRKYDHGKRKNKKVYNSKTPTDYFVENIELEVPIEFYYSDNDNLAAVYDVKRVAKRLGKNVNLYHIKYKEWNHMDFLWATDVKEVINDRILRLVDAFENRAVNRTSNSSLY